jgi:hypothetical protein
MGTKLHGLSPRANYTDRWGQWMEIHGRLSLMWAVDGNIWEAKCDVDSG